MLTAAIYDQGTINTTLPTPGDPTYQTEALSLALRKTLQNLYDEGFEFSRAESTDFTTFGGDAQDAVDDYMERYEEILQTGASEVVAALPDVMPIIAALLSGGSAPVLSILAQGVLDTILRHKDTGVTEAGEETSNADLSGVETRLDNIEAAMYQVLNEFTINILRDSESQTWSIEPSADE